ncbi:hypothetical protein Cgig2_015641 [Carnegiea gigantea]|uniref:Aminotransferase-like plant mobile domain-containing protein n=1 Tax=Carnegiea gigantea TaxID=171969 RepID=A0A9Q1QAN8_9CARY|nr:hypothetical protein Cgig2_015641 [Carnegiea gigantea]
MFAYISIPVNANAYSRGVSENDRGAGSSRSGGAQPGFVMDEEWEMSLGSKYAPSETGSSMEDTVSMVDKSCEAVGGSSSEGDNAEERELTAALVKAWVPRRKAFGLARRLVPFLVYDVAWFTGLPVTIKIVELVMKKLLDANKEPKKLGLWLSLYAWRVMSGVMFPRTPYGAAWSVQKYMEDVRGMGEYASAETMWRVLVEAIEEMQRKLEGLISDVQMNGFSLLIQVWFYEHTTRFVQHDKCRFPLLASWNNVDHEGRYDAFQLVKGIKESEVIPVSHPREEEMLVPTGVLSYEERLERARDELRAEKGKHVDTLRMLEFWKSRANELEARLKMCAAPGETQNTGHQPRGDVGEDVQSDSGLESLARASTPLRMANAAAPVDDCDDVRMPPSVPVIGESDTLLGPHAGEEVANIDAPGPVVDEVYVGGDSVAGEGVCTTPASSTANVQDCTPAATKGVEYEPTVDPGMESVHHGPPMTADSDDVGFEDDGGGKSSNIIAHMMRKPQCSKPAVVYGSPFTDPTHLPGARKSKEERKEGMTGADEPDAADDPGYISAPLLASEMELVTNVRSRFKGVRPNAKQWEEDLQECLPKLVPASWLRGLIHVVPKAGAKDRSRKYCIRATS